MFFILGLQKIAKLIFASRADIICNEETESVQICVLHLSLGGIEFLV